jgi:nucleoside-diphosphate kinase
MFEEPRPQTTLVLIKPDAYQRGLAGAILTRLERRGLTIEEIRVSRDEPDIISAHYGQDPDWLAGLGRKSLTAYSELGLDPRTEFGTADPGTIGQAVRQWLIAFMLSGPLIATAVRGNHAVDVVRAIAGPTLPTDAPAGTIRGDYSCDSPETASRDRRPVRNLVHASADSADADRELKLWFPSRTWS